MRVALLVLTLAFAAVALNARGAADPARAARDELAVGLVSLKCESGGVTATFAIPHSGILWDTQAADAPTAVWIDLSLFDNGFAPGSFLGNGPYTPGGGPATVTWRGLKPDTAHYYRLNALAGGAWFPRPEPAFETPDCRSELAIACDESSSSVAVTFGMRVGITEQAIPLQTWLDLTLRRDGFSPGTFIGSGPFDVQPSSLPTPFEWRGIAMSANHRWRANTLFRFAVNVPPPGLRWIVEDGGSFLTPYCDTFRRAA
jgi:hypothetical protein